MSMYWSVMFAVKIPKELVFDTMARPKCEEAVCAMKDEFKHCPQCGMSREYFELPRTYREYKAPFVDNDGWIAKKVVINHRELDLVETNIDRFELGHYVTTKEFYLGVEIAEIEGDDPDDGCFWSAFEINDLKENAAERLTTAGYMNSTFGLYIVGKAV